MSELTLKAIEQVLDSKLAATRDDLAKQLDAKLAATEKRIIKRIDEAQEELARMVSGGFEDVQSRLDVQQLVEAHSRKFQKLEDALHIKL